MFQTKLTEIENTECDHNRFQPPEVDQARNLWIILRTYNK